MQGLTCARHPLYQLNYINLEPVLTPATLSLEPKPSMLCDADFN